MGDPNGSLAGPVGLILAPRAARWPLWAMMLFGLWLTLSPFSQGWRDEGDILVHLFIGFSVFGLSLFCRLFPTAVHLAHLNALLAVVLLAAQLLGGVPGPLWAGPLLLGLSLVIPITSEHRAANAPPAWYNNPSSWFDRAPIILLLLLGALTARPSRAVAGFFIAALATELIGDSKRWRSAPWLVAGSALGIALCAAAAAGWLAVTPSVLGWGALSAAVLVSVLAFDELRAAALMIGYCAQLGISPGQAFWRGATLPSENVWHSPRLMRKSQEPPTYRGRRHWRRGKTRKLL